MKRKLIPLIFVLFVCINLFMGAQEFGAIDTSANEEFITIFVNGFYADVFEGRSEAELRSDKEDELADLLVVRKQEFVENSGENSENFTRRVGAVYAENLLGNTYFKDKYHVNFDGESEEWDGISTLRSKGNDNVFFYHLFDGMNLETARNAYPDPDTIEVMTDVFMRELGDFNTGSALLNSPKEPGAGYTQQPFIALAKCEWVYRKSARLKALFAEEEYEEIIEKLLIRGPKFHEMLISADDIYTALEGDGIDLKGLTLADLAQELHEIASGTGQYAGTMVPNKFRFVAHSMGGMFLTRFVTEGENDTFGYYQRNAEYTFDEFTADMENYPNLRSRVTMGDFTEEELYRIFKKERENLIDKVVTLDSPISGSPLVDIWKMLHASNLNTNIDSFYFSTGATVVFNIAYSSALVYAGVVLAPFAPWLGLPMLIHGSIGLIGDAIIIGAVFKMKYTELANVILMMRDGRPLPPKPKEGAPTFPPDFFPPDSSLFPELRDKNESGLGTLVARYYDKKSSDTLQKKEGDPIEFNTIGFSGVPAMTSANWGLLNGGISAIQGEIAIGTFQYRLVAAANTAFFEPKEEYPKAFLESNIPRLFFLLGIPFEEGSGVVPGSSSSGEKIEAIKQNPALNSFKINTSTKDYDSLKNELANAGEHNFPAPEWKNEGDSYNDEDYFHLYISERSINEYVAIHGWAQNFLTYPILMQSSKGKDRQLFIKDTNLNRRVEVLDHAKPDYRLPTVPLEPYENLDDKKTDRVYYNYFMHSNDLNEKDSHTIAFREGISYDNSIQYFLKKDEKGLDKIYDGKGLETSLMTIETDSADIVTGRTFHVIDKAIVNNKVLAFPFYVTGYYDGLQVDVSINGRNFIAPETFDPHTGDFAPHTTLDELGFDCSLVERPQTALYRNEKGQMVLVSPKLKEGYNSIRFRFSDPFGTVFYKNLLIMQITVPPFVRPVYPLENQYVNSRDITAVAQSLDISNGTLKPEDWFDVAEVDFRFDGESISYTRDRDTYSFKADLSTLDPVKFSDGNHILEVWTRVYGVENTRTWRFWLDTTAPKITFPENVVFSNNNDGEASLKIYVNDTVPYSEGADEPYPVDTVFAKNITASVGYENGGDIETLLARENTKMGAFSLSWAGKDGDIPVNHGTYSLRVDATDRLGNKGGTAYSKIHVDNQAPGFNTLPTLNTEYVTLATGLLDVSYNLRLDEWEDQGQVVMELRNQGTGENFSFDWWDLGDEDVSHTLTYFVEGVNVVKDGKYDISVYTKDVLGNTDSSVLNKTVIIDRTRPVLDTVYADPFIIGETDTAISLRFSVSEPHDAAVNKSPGHDVTISLVDKKGDAVPGFTTVYTTLNADSTYSGSLNLPADLGDGDYFFKINVADRYGNSREELCAFIKNAIAPVVTFPEDFSEIEGVTGLYGTVIDPKWDNSLAFDHYELYYQLGAHKLPADLDTLSGWSTGAIKTPLYQQVGMKNFGAFPIEAGGIIGYIDVAALGGENGDYVTVLVVAEEDGGYKIGTVSTYLIKMTASPYAVDVEIDPQYKLFPNTHDFNGGADDTVSVTYSVAHEMENPVDIYYHIKDDTGRIIRKNAVFNMQSTKIKGEPVIEGEKGVFVYQDEANGYFWIDIQNNGVSGSYYTLTLKTTHGMTDFVDASLQAFEPQLINPEKTEYAVNHYLEPGASYKFGLKIDPLARMDIAALSGTASAAVYVGKNKLLYDSGVVTVYPGSDYPAIIWDGTDEFGRYVPNGTYTFAVEAFGNKGGRDSDSVDYAITTPYIVSVDSISNKEIQPTLAGMDTCVVKAHINKPAKSVTVDVLTATGGIVKTIIPENIPQNGPGYIAFSWSGLDSSSRPVSPGSYFFRITCEPLDGGPVIMANKTTHPELGEISVQLPPNVDPAIAAEILPFDGAGEFKGDQVVQGDDTYRIQVDAKGQYLPDLNVTMGVEGEGTQIVTAYPQLNYMAGLRSSYTTLGAEIKLSDIKVLMSLRYQNYPRQFPAQPATHNLSWDAVTFDPETNTMIPHSYDSGYFDVVLMENYSISSSSIRETYPVAVEVTAGSAYIDKNKIQVSSSVMRDGSKIIMRIRVQYKAEDLRTEYNGKTLDSTLFLNEFDSWHLLGPDVDPVSHDMFNTDYLYGGLAGQIHQELWHLGYSGSRPRGSLDRFSNPTDTSYLKKDREYRFYYVSELAPVAGEELEPQTYSKEQMYGVSHSLIPFSDYDHKDWVFTDGPTTFTFRKHDPDFTPPSFGSWIAPRRYVGVIVETDAADQISYPFPADRTEFDTGTELATVHVNKERPNNSTPKPYYIVPEAVDGEINIYFDNDIDGTVTLNRTASYSDETGYRAEFETSRIYEGENSPYPDNVTINRWTVTSIDAPGVVFRDTVVGSSIMNGANESFVLTDAHIQGIAGTDWELSRDDQTETLLVTQPREMDLEELNRYGRLKEVRISDLYNFSTVENINPKNLYFTQADGSKTDNPAVVIKPGQRDYTNQSLESGYSVSLLGLDGNPFQGLQLDSETIAYGGKGQKLSDGFIINKTMDIPKQLVPVYGRGEGDVTISYIGGNSFGWQPIPVYNSDPGKNILTYWDVTGLNGQYTLRLVSEVNGKINIATKGVYVGHLLNTVNEDAVISSPGGQATIIFNEGSLPEDTIVNIDTIELEDAKDIAVLPDIAPLGKIISLSKTSEGNFAVKPQLQFTYNKTEIDELGVNPAELVIYHLKEDGTLEPLNTIKELVKVIYDENGMVIDEEPLWDSSVNRPEEIRSIDYTYVRAWSYLDHFSYYVLLEGAVEGVPVLKPAEEITNKLNITLFGEGAANTVVGVYVTDDPLFNTQGKTADYIVQTNQLGEFSVDNLALLYDGRNYIYAGYQENGNSQVAKVIITRDTRAPEISMGNYYPYLSPDGNGQHDTITLPVTVDEESALSVTVIDNLTGLPVLSENEAVPPFSEYNYLFDGYDLYGNRLRDGSYTIAVKAADTLGNLSQAECSFVIDTQKAEIRSSVSEEGISPENGDGVFDSAAITLNASEPVQYTAVITGPSGDEVITLSDTAGFLNTISLSWDGKSSFGSYVPDGYYNLAVTAVDKGGNTKTTIFNHVFTVDNTKPGIRFSSQSRKDLVVPFTKDMEFTLSEAALVNIRITNGQGQTRFLLEKDFSAGYNTFTWAGDENLEDGLYRINMIGADRYGNTKEEYIELTITHDTDPPVLHLPGDLVIEATGKYTQVAIGSALATDVSPPVQIRNDAPSSYRLGNTTVTWNGVDRYGNTAYGTQIITIIDTTPPVLTLPENIEIAATGKLTPFDMPEAWAYDLVDGNLTVYNDAPDAYPIGNTTITYWSLDNQNNKSTGLVTVTVYDDTPPVLTIPDDLVVEAAGKYTEAAIGNATAVDYSSPVTITNNAPQSYPLGNTTVTWQAVDPYGNTAYGNQVVTIIDTTPPELTVPADISIEATALLTPFDMPEGSAYDIVDGNLTVYHDAPLEFPLGDTVVTYWVEDLQNNRSSGTVTVKVYDNTPPVIEITGVEDGIDYTEWAAPVIMVDDYQSGIAESTILLNGENFKSGTAVTEQGVHTLEVNATDHGGNNSYQKISFMIYAETGLVLETEPVQYSDDTVFKASLISRGRAVEGKTITFYYKGAPIGESDTNGSGVAILTHRIDDPQGTYQVDAAFTEDHIGFFRASEDTAKLTVSLEDLTLSYSGKTLFVSDRNVVLQGTITQSSDSSEGELTRCGLIFTIDKLDGHGSSQSVGQVTGRCGTQGVAEVTYSLEPGIYQVKTRTDENGYFTPAEVKQFIVVYDTNGGFVNSGGWMPTVNTQTGVSGNASFTSQVNYINGRMHGVFHFYFKQKVSSVKSKWGWSRYAVDLLIGHTFEWFVLDGDTVHIQGTGKMRGSDETYTFRVSLTDKSRREKDIVTCRIWKGTDTLAEPLYETGNEELVSGHVAIRSYNFRNRFSRRNR